MNQYDIMHQQEEQLFYVALDDDEKAFIKYRLIENRQVDFYSTFVPISQRGKGLAAKLVEHAFRWADEQELTIQASCWYAAKKLTERTQ